MEILALGAIITVTALIGGVTAITWRSLRLTEHMLAPPKDSMIELAEKLEASAEWLERDGRPGAADGRWSEAKRLRERAQNRD